MSISERFQKLDREVATAVDSALENLRRDLEERLRANNEQTLRALADFRAELPPTFVQAEDLGGVEDEIRRTAGEAVLNELLAATTHIDRSKSQADVLTALLSGARRFASRTAIFLLRPNELRGFGGSGFGSGDAAISGLALPRQGALGLAADSSPANLSAEASAELCGRLGIESSTAGVLVPLVLRDRTAAVLYADTTSSEGAPSLAGLQALTYIAAMAIETLPFRERAATATLAAPGETVASAPAAAPAPQAAATAPTPVPESRPEPEPVAPPAAPTPAPAPIAEPTPAPALPSLSAETVRFSAFTADALASSFAAPVAPAQEFPSPLPEIEVEAIAEPDFPPVLAAPSSIDDSLAAIPAAVVTPEPSAPTPRLEPAEPASAAGRETVMLRSLPNLEPPTFVSPTDDTHPNAATPVRSAADLSEVMPPLAEARPSGSPEVRPPSGLQGPGWAFSTGRMPIAPDDEAVHEEARRLARLLVSEIKLYNEEQVQEGRKSRDVYERLKEDIDRSRQMYEERVDPRVIGSTDYFYQELVRILAGGDARALGI